MSRMTLTGAGVVLAAGVTPATFVGEAVHGFQAATDTFDYSGTSAASGDYMLILASGGDAGTTPTFSINGTSVPLINSNTWPSGFTFRLFGRQLGAGDIGHVLDIVGASIFHGCQVVIYRGPTTATDKVFATQASGTTLVFSGFAPSGSSKGVAAMMAINTSTFDPTSSGWADRGGGAYTSAGGTFMTGDTSDKLSGYTNASVTFTATSAAEKAGWLIEFT